MFGVLLPGGLPLIVSYFFLIDAFFSRYIAGASLMGVGGMLAGGCAVGAGLTGGSAFSITAWIALASMWAGAGITDALVDREWSKKPMKEEQLEAVS